MSETAPEPIEEPQKSTRNKKPPRVRWSLEPNDVIAVATLTLFMGLFGGLFAVWFTSDLFSQVQWGPMASWIAGGLTLVAVSISLYQATLARRAAAEADERLQQQLDAGRRNEEVKATAPVWAAVAEVRRTAWVLDEVMYRMADGEASEDDADKIWIPYNQARVLADAAVTTVQMTVQDETIVGLVQQLRESYERLHKGMQDAYGNATKGLWHDQKTMMDEMKKMDDLRQPLINAVREHIARPYAGRKTDPRS